MGLTAAQTVMPVAPSLRAPSCFSLTESPTSDFPGALPVNHDGEMIENEA